MPSKLPALSDVLTAMRTVLADSEMASNPKELCGLVCAELVNQGKNLLPNYQHRRFQQAALTLMNAGKLRYQSVEVPSPRGRRKLGGTEAPPTLKAFKRLNRKGLTSRYAATNPAVVYNLLGDHTWNVAGQPDGSVLLTLAS